MDFRFDGNDRRRLRLALARAGKIRSYRRIQAVLWVAEGRSISEAAQLARASRRSIYYWCEDYLRQRNCSGLLGEKQRSGWPRSPCSQIPESDLEAILHQSPLSLGYQSTGWTLALLATHLHKQFGGTRPSQSTVRRRLHALGWRWKRPRYVFSDPDPQEAQKKEGHPQSVGRPSSRGGSHICHGRDSAASVATASRRVGAKR